MSRDVYFGPRVDFARSRFVLPTAPDSDLRVMPTFGLVDPDAEPITVVATIPDYDESFPPLKEIHVFALPTNHAYTDPAEVLALTPEQATQDRIDVAGVRGEVKLELSGLADGAWCLQPVLVAGAD